MALLLAAILLTACSNSPPPPPSPTPDTRPLGDVTADPKECGLISKQSIERATGLSDFTVKKYMSDNGKHLESCYIYTKPRNESGYRLKIEIDDPSPLPLSQIAGSKASRNGVDLPADAGPGFTFTIVEFGVNYGADGWAWARDGSRMLSVTLAETPSNRDPQKDAAEFIRQLRPIVLDPIGATRTGASTRSSRPA
ncbi:hypothetical protein ETD86_27165 [Nonomuraea turkmeniaca]|uniref:DUF3558 domain-containing protein n=1 Tax=Nonomuraea turkmeniaca TaxID=103838 RepID=A0A5S4FC98_9ACTN|nr:hypothetical protein [Nonomuraea turkmeniaca]TMR15461.1 hypothetical protein ETD86_27165 [Nonomuraea turkmeniaca]